jgi:Spy/CpxP family protein refolding chaperone
MLQILTPEQQAKLELRRKEMERRDSLEKARRDSITKKTTNVCR